MTRELLLLGIPDLPVEAFRERAGGARPATLEGGGGGSSSSATTTTSIDKRLVVETGLGISSDSSTVSVNTSSTDLGAIQQAVALSKDTIAASERALKNTIDLAKSSSEGTGKTFESVIGFAEKALTLTKDNINLAVKNVDQIANAYSTVGDLSTGNRTIAQTGLVIAGIVAAAFVFKGTKL
ncbi:MAG TPA: hypothetical protein VED01_07795 [Burkholderiales bacterium]|nr:hypothetical protein [Burkholderiales bacterium]